MSFIQFFFLVQFHSLASWNGIFFHGVAVFFPGDVTKTEQKQFKNHGTVLSRGASAETEPRSHAGLGLGKVFARILASVGCERDWVNQKPVSRVRGKVCPRAKKKCASDWDRLKGSRIEVPKPQPFRKDFGCGKGKICSFRCCMPSSVKLDWLGIDTSQCFISFFFLSLCGVNVMLRLREKSHQDRKVHLSSLTVYFLVSSVGKKDFWQKRSRRKFCGRAFT